MADLQSASLADRPDFDELVLGDLKRRPAAAAVDVARSMCLIPENPNPGWGPTWQAVHQALKRLSRRGLVRRIPGPDARWEALR